MLPAPPPAGVPAPPGPETTDEGTVVFSVPPVISSRPPDDRAARFGALARGGGDRRALRGPGHDVISVR